MWIIYNQEARGPRLLAMTLDRLEGERRLDEAVRRGFVAHMIEETMTNSELEKVLVFKARWNNRLALMKVANTNDDSDDVAHHALLLAELRGDPPKSLSPNDRRRVASLRTLDY
jgi:hypothetical protein